MDPDVQLLIDNLEAFASEAGQDYKKLLTLITGAGNITNLANLKTATKASLVAAINELFDALGSASGGGAAISDGTTTLTSTWSSSKIAASIDVVATQVTNILAVSPEAYNSFKEVADYIAADKSGAEAVLGSLQNRIRVDAVQSFSSEQVNFGMQNLEALGAARKTDVDALRLSLGDLTVDLRAAYIAARDS